MNKRVFTGISLLLLASLVWGGAFSAQRNGMDFINPAQFNAIRFFIASLALLPVIFVTSFQKKEEEPLPGGLRALLVPGIICGTILGIASLFQQQGLLYASAGKAGFLTAIYIIMVPLLGIFAGKKTPPLLWGAVAVALGGTYLLCSPSGMSEWNRGDFLLLLCAGIFSLHILTIDRYAPKVDAMKVSAVQFMTAAVTALFWSLATGEQWNIADIKAAWLPILYCAVFSSSIGYTAQFFGQKYVNPVAASLIMSLEAVFAAVGGFLMLDEKMTPQEWCGGLIIMAAVIMAQIPGKTVNVPEKC